MHQSRAQTVAAGLGFFSIGLGLAELIAPRLVRQALGLRCADSVVRLYGAREIATGVGILLAWKRAPWVWGRVAGDALDLATARRPAGIAALAGVTLVDIATAARLSREENAPPPRRYDYSHRSGFPRPAEEMRGAARAKKERAQGPLSFEATTRV
jgi:hypothetical protein